MTEAKDIWTILKMLEWTTGYLAGRGVENARRESEWLLAATLKLDRMGLYLNFDRPLNETELAAYRGVVSRRAQREPLQYILGSQEFMGLEFEVAPGVLIPRYDTETLVLEAINRAAGAKRILDVGVGSGCIAVTLASKLPQAQIWGVDISEVALEQARRNATRHGVAIELRGGSYFDPLSGERFDLIVANPPYIRSADIADLQPEVRQFEPLSALDGGSDGLDPYRQMIPSALDHLSPRGWLIFEVGYDQAPLVIDLFQQQGGYGELFTAHDPQGVERVVGGRLL